MQQAYNTTTHLFGDRVHVAESRAVLDLLQDVEEDAVPVLIVVFCCCQQSPVHQSVEQESNR